MRSSYEQPANDHASCSSGSSMLSSSAARAENGLKVDPGCRNRREWASEDPACNDGVDNDGDALIDAADPQCAASPAWWTHEDYPIPASCGLGFELVLVIPPLAAIHRRRARAS